MKSVQTKPERAKVANLNRALGQVRNKVRLDLAEFARFVGVSKQTAKDVSSGVTRCSPALAAKAEFIFGLDRQSVLAGKDARDVFGKPYSEESFLKWCRLNALSWTELSALKKRTSLRMAHLLEAANNAGKTISFLAALEEASIKAVQSLGIQREVETLHARLPDHEKIPIADSTFDEVKRLIKSRLREKP